MSIRRCSYAVVLAACLCGAGSVRAQIPVTDVAAIVQLLAQLQQLQEQLLVAKRQLEQARDLYESMTGPRGVERLLSGVVRNYLPEDWQQLVDAMQGVSAAYSALAMDVRATIEANALLTPDQIAALDPNDRELLEAVRSSTALHEALARSSLATTSRRFEEIQSLIDAIGSAEDQKAILDLQARITAEQNMLTNEANKLHVLAQAAQAQRHTHEQRQMELRVNGIGRLRDLTPLGL